MPAWATPLFRPVWCVAIASSFSMTVTTAPGRSCVRRRATARPMIPAPTTPICSLALLIRSPARFLARRARPLRPEVLLRGARAVQQPEDERIERRGDERREDCAGRPDEDVDQGEHPAGDRERGQHE